MKFRNKFAALSALLIFQFCGVQAAAIDDELAIISAEQNEQGKDVEVFNPEPEPTDADKNKSAKELREEEKRLEEERKAARKQIEEERKRSRDEITGKVPISKNPMPPDRPVRVTPPPVNENETAEPEPLNQNPNPPVEETKPVEEPQIKIPSPIINYSKFEDLVQIVHFTPLYIPKKSGYTITSMMTIDNLAEIRYTRKWEPNVSLHIRTYKRALGEELKDVSGVNGVKWRVNTVDGITVYIAKIDETKQVAAWAVGNYTFSAYVENLSFAAFHSFVTDELVDLTTHYFIGN